MRSEGVDFRLCQSGDFRHEVWCESFGEHIEGELAFLIFASLL